MTGERLIGVSCGGLSVLLFSSFTLASRWGFSSALAWPDLAALRFGIGGSLLLPVLLRRGLRGVPWRDAATLAWFGGLGFALCAYAGFALAPASHGAVLLHGTIPLFTYAITHGTVEQPRQRHHRIGIYLIALGIALMGYDSWASASRRQLLGDAALLLASAFWSTYGVLSRRKKVPPIQSAAIVAVFSMCAFLPAYALLPGKALPYAHTGELLLQAIVQGLLIGTVSIFVYTRAVASLGASETALFTAFVPCITTLAAVPLLSEWPTHLGWAGVAVVSFGMLVALRPRSTQNKASQGRFSQDNVPSR